MVPTCERCPTPLRPTQGRFCGRPCFLAGTTKPPRPCDGCGGRFRAKGTTQRFCGHACAERHQGRPGRDELLAILRANRHTWLTPSDLAFWLFGDAAPADVHAAQTRVYRLRRDGHRVESRPAPWDLLGPGRRLAYRLIEATAATRRAAA